MTNSTKMLLALIAIAVGAMVILLPTSPVHVRPLALFGTIIGAYEVGVLHGEDPEDE